MLGWTKEVFYAVIYFILSVSNIAYTPAHGEFVPAKPNIVLVYGLSATPPVMLPLKHKLEEAGFNVIIADTGWARDDIDVLAERLDNFLKEREKVLNQRHGLTLADMQDRTILFGHSMGGLIIVAAQRYDRQLLKFQVVSAATPFRGAPSAYIAFWRWPAYEMRPDAAWLEGLAKDMKSHPRQLFQIRAESDETVPAGSSVLTGYPHYVAPFPGHIALIFALEPQILKPLVNP